MKSASPALLSYLNKAIASNVYPGGTPSATSGVLGQGVLGEMVLGEGVAPSSTVMQTARGSSRFIKPDCFTLTLVTGDVFRWTNADVDVTVFPADATSAASGVLGAGVLGEMVLGKAAEAPTVFKSNSVQIDGMKYKISVGLEVDEQTIKLSAKQTDLILGVPALEAIRLGVLDGATLERDRAFLTEWNTAALGTVALFHGTVSSIDQIGRTTAQIKIKSDLNRLNINYPRNIYQASCLHTLFDAGCTLAKADFVVAGAVGAGGSTRVLPWAGATVGQYDQGTLIFTSGANAGVWRSVQRSTGAALIVIPPLDNLPAEGDAFTITPGCDHTDGPNGCAKFANTVNFRGFDFVPLPSVAY